MQLNNVIIGQRFGIPIDFKGIICSRTEQISTLSIKSQSSSMAVNIAPEGWCVRPDCKKQPIATFLSMSQILNLPDDLRPNTQRWSQAQSGD